MNRIHRRTDRHTDTQTQEGKRTAKKQTNQEEVCNPPWHCTTVGGTQLRKRVRGGLFERGTDVVIGECVRQRNAIQMAKKQTKAQNGVMGCCDQHPPPRRGRGNNWQATRRAKARKQRERDTEPDMLLVEVYGIRSRQRNHRVSSTTDHTREVVVVVVGWGGFRAQNIYNQEENAAAAMNV